MAAVGGAVVVVVVVVGPLIVITSSSLSLFSPSPPHRSHAGIVIGSSWWGPSAIPHYGGALVLIPHHPLSPQSLLLSHCFEVNLFPPHEQLLTVVVLGAEVVVVLSS